MIQKLITFFVLAFYAGFVIGQPCAFTYDIGGKIQIPEQALEDSDGNFLLIGRHYGFVDTNGILPSNIDIAVLKTDAQGRQQWFKTFDFSSVDEVKSILQHTDGSYVLMASVCESEGEAGCMRRNLTLLKLSKEGELLWQKALYREVIVLPGHLLALADGFAVMGETTKFDKNSRDLFVSRLDQEGNILWERRIPALSGRAFNLARSSDGGYIVGGSSINRQREAFIAKLSSEGDSLWTKPVGKSGFFGLVSVLSDDRMSVVSKGDAKFNEQDLFFLNPAGELLWSKNLENYFSFIQTSTLAPDGILVAGDKAGTSGRVGVLAKFDFEGNLLWDKTYSPFAELGESVFSVLIRQEGELVLAGQTERIGPNTERYPLDLMLVLLDQSAEIKTCLISSRKQIEKAGQVRISPNPFAQSALVEWPAGSVGADASYRLFDLQGRLLRSGPVTGNPFSLERSGLSPGLYILGIQDPGLGLFFREKVVIE